MTHHDPPHPRSSHRAAEAVGLPHEVIDVGRRLRALREARSLSIRALAEASGLAINTLSLIEHGKTSPSVSTLQQLAQALQVPITAFFAPEVPALPWSTTRPASSGRRLSPTGCWPTSAPAWPGVPLSPCC